MVAMFCRKRWWNAAPPVSYTHLDVYKRQGNGRDVLVFIHGFNNSYDEARLRLTQIVADSNFAGVPVLFTWPSRSSMWAVSYTHLPFLF